MEFLNVGLPEDIRQHILAGNFNKAKELIDIYYKHNISSLLEKRLDFELLRIKMLDKHYTYSLDRALNLCKEKISDFKENELQFLIDKRYADWIYFNGEIRLSNNFLDNIIKVNNDIKNRLVEKESFDKSGELRKQVVNEIINNGSKTYYIHVKTGLRVKIDENVKGNMIKVHIPIPKNAQQIKDIKILNTNCAYKYISNENHPQRTIYFENKLKNENEFLVEYSYENHIKYNKLDYDNVADVQPKFYLNENLPHIKFSPFLVELAADIVKNERNPLRKARLIYDYITQNVQYSFMRPYAAIESIAEYCGYNLKGDCGVQALLFITLCRISGVPARWQSGLYVTPYYIGCHDWAEFYIEPYGWLFADPSFGGGARRNNDLIGWNFYFGNLDPFRMVANDYFQYPLYPEKKFLRSDPYDNQVGEAETEMIDLNDYVESIMEIVEVKEID